MRESKRIGQIGAIGSFRAEAKAARVARSPMQLLQLYRSFVTSIEHRGHYRPPASAVPLGVHAKSRSFIPYRSRIIVAIHLSSIRRISRSIRRSTSFSPRCIDALNFPARCKSFVISIADRIVYVQVVSS